MSNAKHIELKRFLCYSAYAFGAPIIAVILIIAVKSSSFVTKEYKFRIEPLTCWLKDNEAEFIYVYLPVGLILTFNIIFYCITAFKIFKAQKEAKAAMRHDSKRHSRSTDQNRWAVAQICNINSYVLRNSGSGFIFVYLSWWEWFGQRSSLRGLLKALSYTSSAFLTACKASSFSSYSFVSRKWEKWFGERE